MNVLKKLHRLLDPEKVSGRYKDGRRDLLKGLANGSPISNEQKSEIIAYWQPYLNSCLARYSWDIRWYDIYNKVNVFGSNLTHFVPDSYYYCVVDRFFNNAVAAQALDDKNLYDLLLNDAPQPKTICRRIGDVLLDNQYKVISLEQAMTACKQAGKIILKPSLGTCAGAGISVWNGKIEKEEVLKSILQIPRSFVVQDFVEQSKSLSQFNATCVNTRRIVTLLFQGEVHVVSQVVIMGGKEALTNHLHRGGLVCGIMSDGRLRELAFDGNLTMYKQHPNGQVFADCQLPNYHKCIDLVKAMAFRVSQVSKLVAWDVTLNADDEPLIIETNLSWGGSVQVAGSPALGDITDEVLQYIAKQKIDRK